MKDVLAVAKQFWIPIILALIVLISVGLFAAGYSLEGGRIVRLGTLAIVGVPDGTKVYLDEARLYTANGGGTTMNADPGTHSVIVDVEGMQPWNELFVIKEATTTTLSPILVPQKSNEKSLSADDLKRAPLAFKNYALPTKDAPLMLAGGCAQVYVLYNNIVADAAAHPGCTVPDYLTCAKDEEQNGACPPTLIFTPKDRITTLLPYGSRKDAVILAAGDAAYVIELDPRDPQFFSPLVHQTGLRLAPWTATELLIASGRDYYTITIP